MSPNPHPRTLDARRSHSLLTCTPSRHPPGSRQVLITSNSEFSALAQSLYAPEALVLCPPRRPGPDNRGLPCDQTCVPNSILTQPSKWGARAVASSALSGVDRAHVHAQLARLWPLRGASPLWSREDHGIRPFDYEAPVEAGWAAVRDDYDVNP